MLKWQCVWEGLLVRCYCNKTQQWNQQLCLPKTWINLVTQGAQGSGPWVPVLKWQGVWDGLLVRCTLQNTQHCK